MAILWGWWAAGFQLARAPVFQCPNVSSKGFSGRSGYLLVEWEGHQSRCRSLGVCPAQSLGCALQCAVTLGVLTSKHPSCQAAPRDRQDPAALDLGCCREAEGHASKKKTLPKVLLPPKHGTCWAFLATSAGTSLRAPILFTFSAACSLLGKGGIHGQTLESSESLPEESELAERPREQT